MCNVMDNQHACCNGSAADLNTAMKAQAPVVSQSSLQSGFMEDASSASSDSLYNMSSLLKQLPFKRGLSKHYKGKCQSFRSLSNVRSLEDLAKAKRNPYKTKLKPMKRSGPYGRTTRSRSISKKVIAPSSVSSCHCSSSSVTCSAETSKKLLL